MIGSTSSNNNSSSSVNHKYSTGGLPTNSRDSHDSNQSVSHSSHGEDTVTLSHLPEHATPMPTPIYHGPGIHPYNIKTVRPDADLLGPTEKCSDYSTVTHYADGRPDTVTPPDFCTINRHGMPLIPNPDPHIGYASFDAVA